jgi:hypothetical protein
VIVNLQKTPYDSRCHLKVYAKCDEFMKLVLAELGIENELDTSYDHLKYLNLLLLNTDLVEMLNFLGL